MKGFGGQINYGDRIEDPRVGRFYSIDPLQIKYPWYTPYQFAGNTPIQAKDVDGLEPAHPYMDSRGQWRETHQGDNLSVRTIPSGHEQYLRNTTAFNTVKVENEEFTSALNFVPLVGEIKGLHEGITGEEWFTGRRLSSDERKMALLPVRIKGGTGVLNSEGKQLIREETAVARSSEHASAAHGGNSAADANSIVLPETSPRYDPNKPAVVNKDLTIPASSNGYAPDFKGTPHLYPVNGNQKNIVQVRLTGSYSGDFAAANSAAGLGAKTPKGYTWHHLDDYNPSTGTSTMQLVKTPIHQATIPHTGSVKQYETVNNATYKQ